MPWDEDDKPRSVADARTRLEVARKHLEEAQAAYNSAEADKLRLAIQDVRERYPLVERVGVSFGWNYDDEGSYYWGAYPALQPGGDDERWPRVEKKSRYSDRTYEVSEYDLITETILEGFGVDAWAAAVGIKHVDEGTNWVPEEQG